MDDMNRLKSMIISMAKNVVQMTTASGSGHPSSALSLVHIVGALMGKQMRWDPKDPWNPVADRLVLSEGHSVPVVYAAMAELGAVMGKDRASAEAITSESLLGLRDIDSMLDGHPNPRIGMSFFDSATGLYTDRRRREQGRSDMGGLRFYY